MDCSHLPITCLNGGAEAMKQYLNFRGFYSIFLMALLYHRFIWASVGAPANTHDSTLLQSTDLRKRISEGEMIPNVVQQVTLKYRPLFWMTEPSHCEHLC